MRPQGFKGSGCRGFRTGLPLGLDQHCVINIVIRHLCNQLFFFSFIYLNWGDKKRSSVLAESTTACVVHLEPSSY